jgi:hypothetical protein
MAAAGLGQDHAPPKIAGGFGNLLRQGHGLLPVGYEILEADLSTAVL